MVLFKLVDDGWFNLMFLGDKLALDGLEGWALAMCLAGLFLSFDCFLWLSLSCNEWGADTYGVLEEIPFGKLALDFGCCGFETWV